VASIARRRTKSGENRYDVRYRTPTGQVRNKTFRTRRDAHRFTNTVEADKLRGAWVDPRRARITLTEYADGWLEQRPRLRPRTRETYKSQLRLHVYPTLGEIELGRVTPELVRSWHSMLASSDSPSMAAKCYRLLRTILATGVDDELLVRNPCRIERAGVERPAERPQASAGQVFELADAMPERFRALVLVAGFMGLRLGELLGLRCRHLDLLHGTITIDQQEHQLADGRIVVGPPKSEAGVRTVALPPFLVAELETHLSRFASVGLDGRVFPAEQGGPLRRHVLQKHWSAARARARYPRRVPFSRSPTHGQHTYRVDGGKSQGVDESDGSRLAASCARLSTRDTRTRFVDRCRAQ
jgi:hypothetical protein